MDLTYINCPERIDLERCAHNLVSELFGRTQRLMMLIGKGRTEFMAAKTSCADVRQEIVEAQDLLRAHRAAHGC